MYRQKYHGKNSNNYNDSCYRMDWIVPFGTKKSE